MKQFQFEVKNFNNLRKELLRVKRFCRSEYHTSVYFQIFTTETDFSAITSITSEIENNFPEAYYYGCQTYGNIYEGCLSDASTMIVCSVFEFETTKCCEIYIDPLDPECPFSTLQDVWDFCNENPWVKAVELTPSYKSADLIGIGKKIQNLREDVQVCGGIAFNPLEALSNSTYIFSKNKGFSDTAAIAILLGGEDLFVMSSYVSGWETLGKSFTITGCEENRITKIDNDTPMEIYRKYLNTDQNDPEFLRNSILFPLVFDYNGVEVIRIPSAVSDSEDAYVIADVEEGMKVRLSYGDKTTILNSVKSKLREIAATAPDTLRIYSCAYRRLFWGDKEVSSETSMFDYVAPTVGFYTRGEILRVGDFLHYFNSTIVYCVLREGEAYEQDTDYDDILSLSQENTGLAPRLINYVTAVTKELESEFFSTVKGLAGIYRSVLVIDTKEKNVISLNPEDIVDKILAEKGDYTDRIQKFVKTIVVDKYTSEAEKFCDFSTLPARLKNKNYVDCELIGKTVGWFRAMFVVTKRDSNDIPIQYIFTTQIIDSEKKREEILVKNSITDTMTGLLNRRAYEEDIHALEGKPLPETQTVFSIDLNGLKNANDALGHSAGDEMIAGAAECIRETLGKCGDVYRTGGDEFTALLKAAPEKIKEACSELNERIASWKGEKSNSLSLSYGYVSAGEAKAYDILELLRIADKRMYEAKEDYYTSHGIDRRGNRVAFDIICDSYRKILKVNLTADTYDIIRAEKNELTPETGFVESCFSGWIKSFAESGQVYPDDIPGYLEKTDLNFLRELFAKGDKNFSLHYRRKIGDSYKNVLMEMMAFNSAKTTDTEVYLYVKDIQ